MKFLEKTCPAAALLAATIFYPNCSAAAPATSDLMVYDDALASGRQIG